MKEPLRFDKISLGGGVMGALGNRLSSHADGR
jgi:hypothetical protein